MHAVRNARFCNLIAATLEGTCRVDEQEWPMPQQNWRQISFPIGNKRPRIRKLRSQLGGL
ncbi:hypothetical protein PMI11_01802 [Rhizobium sp. CF142]|nr:hypothetical protein PMI11_01802 [Rhizobium sp. CF142]